jgi:cytochrome c-type biogenesis protein CcmH
MAENNLNHEFHEFSRISLGLFRVIRVIRGKGFAVASGLVAMMLLALATQAASAQSGTPPPTTVTDDDVNRVAHQLYCPVCENIPLDVCPTQACIQWRATIHDKLAAGWTDQQILDYFVAQYGERVLARPSTHGINILVWVIPPLLLLGGAAVLWRFLRQVQPPAAPAGPASGGDEYSERLEQELRKRI